MWTEVQETYGQDRFATPQFYSQSFFDRFSMKPSYLAAGGTACGLVYHEAFRRAKTKDPVHVHDLQATILRCLGIDHTKLTYKYQGRHFRLTDVSGELVKPILA